METERRNKSSLLILISRNFPIYLGSINSIEGKQQEPVFLNAGCHARPCHKGSNEKSEAGAEAQAVRILTVPCQKRQKRKTQDGAEFQSLH